MTMSAHTRWKAPSMARFGQLVLIVGLGTLIVTGEAVFSGIDEAQAHVYRNQPVQWPGAQLRGPRPIMPVPQRRPQRMIESDLSQYVRPFPGAPPIKLRPRVPLITEWITGWTVQGAPPSQGRVKVDYSRVGTSLGWRVDRQR